MLFRSSSEKGRVYANVGGRTPYGMELEHINKMRPHKSRQQRTNKHTDKKVRNWQNDDLFAQPKRGHELGGEVYII